MRVSGVDTRKLVRGSRAAKLRAWVVGLGVVALVLVVSSCGQGSVKEIDFTGRRADPPFTVSNSDLEDTSGRRVALGPDPEARRLRLVFFGYTQCPDICPTVLSSLAAGLVRLAADDRKQVQTYFITTDPKRDTGAVMSEYLSRIDPSFKGLRGALDVTAGIAKSVGVYVDQGETLPSGGYDPNSHGVYIIAIDRHGKAPVFWNGETSPSEFANDIEFMLHGSV
jgi:protein SCO1